MPTPPNIFQIIQNKGITHLEMYRTFNMGVGFCVVAPKNEVSSIQSIFRKNKMKSYQIGKIIEKKGVYINSLKLT